MAGVSTNTSENGVQLKNEKHDPQKDGMASLDELIRTIRIIVTESSDEDGWAFLGEVGKRLNKRYPDFDTRNYGHTKLTPLISSLKQFEIQPRKTSNPNIIHYFIKINRRLSSGIIYSLLLHSTRGLPLQSKKDKI